MLSFARRAFTPAVSFFASIVFLDSLRFKFTNAIETQVIFGKLNAWAATFGAQGLFAQTGLFSQYVIGSAELVASTLLLVGLLPNLKRLNALGAAIGFAVMSGAVSFHLFTPLGIDPNNDGGGLFAAAVTIWVSTLTLLIIHRNEVLELLGELGRAFIPTPQANPPRSAFKPQQSKLA
ncbi:MAG: hypothetical protein ACOYKM_07335 [Caulobacterales bacterium]|jgi:hypothetical protein